MEKKKKAAKRVSYNPTPSGMVSRAVSFLSSSMGMATPAASTNLMTMTPLELAAAQYELDTEGVKTHDEGMDVMRDIVAKQFENNAERTKSEAENVQKLQESVQKMQDNNAEQREEEAKSVQKLQGVVTARNRLFQQRQESFRTFTTLSEKKPEARARMHPTDANEIKSNLDNMFSGTVDYQSPNRSDEAKEEERALDEGRVSDEELVSDKERVSGKLVSDNGSESGDWDEGEYVKRMMREKFTVQYLNNSKSNRKDFIKNLDGLAEDQLTEMLRPLANKGCALKFTNDQLKSILTKLGQGDKKILKKKDDVVKRVVKLASGTPASQKTNKQKLIKGKERAQLWADQTYGG